MSDDLWKASSTEDYEDDGEGADENGNWPLDKIVGEEVDYSGEILCAFLSDYICFFSYPRCRYEVRVNPKNLRHTLNLS